MTATTAVAVYIERRRGAAQGITLAIGAAGISLAPIALESLIYQHGFERVWLIEGLTVWAVAIPLTLLGLPHRPQQEPSPGNAAPAPGRPGDPLTPGQP